MAYKWLLVIVLSCTWAPQITLEKSTDKNEPRTIKELESILRNFARSISKQLLAQTFRVTTEANVSVECSLSLFQLLADFGNLRDWAVKMFDSSAKLPVGIAIATSLFLGDYEECLDTVATNRRNKINFQGKYCLVKFGFSEDIWQSDELPETEFFATIWPLLKSRRGSTVSDLTMHFGLCVPSTCTAQEINRVAGIYTRNFGIATNVTCKTRTNKEPNSEQVVLLCGFAILGFLVVVGTSLDIMNQHSNMKMKSGLIDPLIAFSIHSNTVRLFRTVQNDTTLSAIRGCRVLTSFWIILVHTYFWPSDYYFLKYRGTLRYLEFSRELMFKTVSIGTMANDSFFLISGTLFVYTSWKELEEIKGWIKPVTSVLLKMSKFVPILMFFIALIIIFPLLGYGPIWDEALRESYDNCRKNWWPTLLFIQNYWEFNEECMPHAWFLSVLTQLLPLASVIGLVLHRCPKFGIAISVLLILIGCITIGILTSSYSLPPSLVSLAPNIGKLQKLLNIIHIQPYSYVCSLFTGVLLGYSISVKQHSKIKPCTQFLAWFMSTCGVLSVMYSLHFFGESEEFRLAYAALHKTIWSFSLSWVLFACLTGRGGIVGRILSWRGMIPIDRVVLLIYLLHPIVLMWQTAGTRTAVYLGHLEQVYVFLATTIITVGLSYIINVTFEQPMQRFHSFIVRKLSRKVRANIMAEAIAPSSKNNLAVLREIATSGNKAFEENVSKL